MGVVWVENQALGFRMLLIELKDNICAISVSLGKAMEGLPEGTWG